ncbi:MAG: hypothetical protein IJV62_01140 [Eggerthellaceae bacterium]|nr:hypothetical protein [Eggerthellaceae bacterium]
MKSFEDEFMNLQTGLVSLCLEATESIDDVEKMFIYCSIEKALTSFNAFFMKGGDIVMLSELGLADGMSTQFLREGTYSLRKLRTLCAEYNMDVPNEMRLYFDVKTQKFSADYKYEPVCGAATGIASSDVIMAWVEEERAKLRN